MTEAGPEIGVAAVLGSKDLDGDVSAELLVVGAIDRRHPALPEQLDQPVAAPERAADLRHSVVSFVRPAARGPGRRRASYRTASDVRPPVA